MHCLILFSEIYGQIMTIAENAETPLSPSVIHERLGGPNVCSFWDVRRCLFNMQDKQIMNNIDDRSWILHEKYDGKLLYIDWTVKAVV